DRPAGAGEANEAATSSAHYPRPDSRISCIGRQPALVRPEGVQGKRRLCPGILCFCWRQLVGKQREERARQLVRIYFGIASKAFMKALEETLRVRAAAGPRPP